MVLIIVFVAVDEGQDLFDLFFAVFGLNHDLVDPEDGIQVEHLLLVPVNVLQQDHCHHFQSL